MYFNMCIHNLSYIHFFISGHHLCWHSNMQRGWEKLVKDVMHLQLSLSWHFLQLYFCEGNDDAWSYANGGPSVYMCTFLLGYVGIYTPKKITWPLEKPPFENVAPSKNSDFHCHVRLLEAQRVTSFMSMYLKTNCSSQWIHSPQSSKRTWTCDLAKGCKSSVAVQHCRGFGNGRGFL